MFIDARKTQTSLLADFDVCVVGAGAAGITLTCELEAKGLSVLLVEGGGRTFSKDSQDSYRGETDEEGRHSPPHMYRRRLLGGSTTIWGGRCVPLDPIDFEKRDYIPFSGWPLSRPDLDAFYTRAQTYLQADEYAYNVFDLLGSDQQTIQGFESDVLESFRLEQFSPPTDFGKVYGPALERSRAVTVLLNATCVRIVGADGGKVVTSLEMATPGGKRFEVKSRYYVLASGGLEVTRLLIASDSSRQGGLGNHSEKLGRFYMCHIENTLGQLRLTPHDRGVVTDFERTARGIYARRKFTLSEEAQRHFRMPNFTFRLHHSYISDPEHRNGILSAMYLAKDAILPEYRRKMAVIELAKRAGLARDGRFWLSHVRNILLDAGKVTHFAWRWAQLRTFASRKLPFVVLQNPDGTYPLDFNAEQVPNPDSTVQLSMEKDRYGMPRLRVNWRMAEEDVTNIVRTYRLIRTVFQESGCADLDFNDATIEDEVRQSTPVGGHHIGTARMAASKADGVVDPNCQVYNVPNLFVASSAVFPTCGHANPTLTIVALAIRLADHLKVRKESDPIVLTGAAVNREVA